MSWSNITKDISVEKGDHMVGDVKHKFNLYQYNWHLMTFYDDPMVTYASEIFFAAIHKIVVFP